MTMSPAAIRGFESKSATVAGVGLHYRAMNKVSRISDQPQLKAETK
jgi:hypothetical protein